MSSLRGLFLGVLAILFLAAVTHADQTSFCVTIAMMSEGIAVDRDSGISRDRELTGANVLLVNNGVASKEMVQIVLTLINRVYDSPKISPSEWEKRILAQCQR